MEYYKYNSPEFKKYLKKSAHRDGEAKFLKSIVNKIKKKNITAVEIGSNRGITAMVIANVIGKNSKLYAFEPVPLHYLRLKKNLASSKIFNVESRNFAVIDKLGKIDLHLEGTGTSIVKRNTNKKTKVPAVNLDGFLKQEGITSIDLLHMDCEASELLAFKGAKKILQNSKVHIFCEIHHESLKKLGKSIKDIVNYLEKLNFKVKPLWADDLNKKISFKDCSHIYARK